MNLGGMLALVLILAASLLPTQSQSQQPEPPGPPAQAPATKAPPKHPTHSTVNPAQPENTFLGEIILVNGTYYLRSGDAQYKLQDQGKGKHFAGQAVEVKGSLDGHNVLHIQAIGIHQ